MISEKEMFKENKMKGLKKIALVSAIAAVSVSAQAELKALDDSTMGTMTGQAGLTIDVNAARINIGAVDYKDAGFLSIKDIAITDSTFANAIDNIRLTVDVAGGTMASGADLGVSALGATYLAGTVAHPLVDAAEVTVAGEVDQNALISDGDLVIALRSKDLATNGLVDYGLHIGSVELGASTNTAGSVSGGTVLVSDLNLAGTLGPIDIVVDGNNGGMNINAYFNAAGTMTLPFVNTSMNLSIHNSRGAEKAQITLASGTQVSFAHAQMNIKSDTNGLAFDLQDFSGDIDMTNIVLGSAPSIGDVYMTDFKMSAETVVYGH